MLAIEKYALPDAARRLSLSWGRTWNLLLRGELDGAKEGGRWYVTAASVDAAAERLADEKARG